MEQDNNFTILKSRTGASVPVVNNVQLHSLYNPEKEAKAFAESNLGKIKSNDNFLFLGLGFAYHIEEFIKLAKNFHPDFGIVIIEPNRKLVDHYLDQMGDHLSEGIICYSNIKEYYNDPTIIEFLMLSPAVIGHKTSIESNNFFKNFLTYKGDENLHSSRNLISNIEIREYIENDPCTLDELAHKASLKQSISKTDALFMALGSIKQEG